MAGEAGDRKGGQEITPTPTRIFLWRVSVESPSRSLTADCCAYLKSASLNWSLKPRTRGSISICRRHWTSGSVPGGAPVGRASSVCWPGRKATWRLPFGRRMAKGATPGVPGSWFRMWCQLSPFPAAVDSVGLRERMSLHPESLYKEAAGRL